MTDEQLIKIVKRYPVLYDMSLSQYRDLTIRNDAWEEIAEQLKTTVEDIKNRWGKLRNCFTNALKRRHKKRGQAAATMVPWRHEKQMEFLLPHLKGRPTASSLSDSNDDEATQYPELLFSDESTSSPFHAIRTPTPSSTPTTRASCAVSAPVTSPTPRRNKNNEDNLLKEMVMTMKSTQELRQKRALTELDENDHFFLSMSKQLKKLPQTDQAEIKFQLHKLIYESEMKMLSSQNNQKMLLSNQTVIKPKSPIIIKSINIRPSSCNKFGQQNVTSTPSALNKNTLQQVSDQIIIKQDNNNGPTTD